MTIGIAEALRFSAATRFGAVAENQQESTIRARAKEAFGLDQVDLVVDRKATDTPQEVVNEFRALVAQLRTRGKAFVETLKALRQGKGLGVEPPYGQHGVSIITHTDQPGNLLENLLDGVTNFVAKVFKRISQKFSASWFTKENQPDGKTLRLETPLQVTPEVITKLADLPDGGQLKLRQFLVTVAPKLAETSDTSAIEVQAKPDSEESTPAQETKSAQETKPNAS